MSEVAGPSTSSAPMRDPGDFCSLSRRECSIAFRNISHKREVKTPLSRSPLLSCCSQKQRTTKQLLQGVSGVLEPGLNAIMGPSGSGKSTLLNILSGRTDLSSVSGTVYLNGGEVLEGFSKLVGYVGQNNCIMGTLSVKENIWFSANLRLPSVIKFAEKKRRVTNIITQLSLESCQDTKIGTELIRGASGGEKKRTAIGMELVIQPPVIFLDEATSGLDASTAHAVILLLKQLTRQGINIILSIHQPRCSVYRLFDTLTILGEGRLMFHGPMKYTLPYFKSIGYDCGSEDNPAEYFQDVVSGDIDVELGNLTLEDEVLKREQLAGHTERLAFLYRSSAVHAKLMREIMDGVRTQSRKLDVSPGPSVCSQMLTLSRRAFKNMLRHPLAFASSVVMNLMIGVIFGLIYFQVDFSLSSGRQNRLGFLFFVCSNMIFGTFGAIEVFTKEREMFLHEHKSGHYSVLAYFLSKLFADLLPLRTIAPLLFCSVTYWMVGLKPDGEAFFTFVLTVLLLVYAATGIGLFYSATFGNFATASIFIALTFVFAILFDGFLINGNSILPWLRWLRYLSIARYGFTALCINEFRGLVFQDCSINSTYLDGSLSSNGTSVYPTSLATYPAVFLTPMNESSHPIDPTIGNFGMAPVNRSCMAINGEDILIHQLSVTTLDGTLTQWCLWQNHVALAIIAAFMFILSYVQLTRLTKVK